MKLIKNGNRKNEGLKTFQYGSIISAKELFWILLKKKGKDFVMETSLKLERVNPQEGKGYTREATTICNTGSKMAQTRY